MCGNWRTVKLPLEHGMEVKSVTTLKPPRSWTPYDMLVHPNIRKFLGSDGSDEPILHALGKPKEAGMGSRLPEDHIDYDQLVAEDIPRGFNVCGLCCTPVQVCYLFSAIHSGKQAC